MPDPVPDPISGGYEDLAEFIKLQTPYDDQLGDNMGPNAELLATAMDGPLKDNSVVKIVDENGVPTPRPNNFPNPTLEDGQQQECGWWYFQGKLIRVTKSMRVPYVFTRNGQRVQAHILIGYTGPSA